MGLRSEWVVEVVRRRTTNVLVLEAEGSGRLVTRSVRPIRLLWGVENIELMMVVVPTAAFL
jgi:hypothetical protein